MEGISFQPPKVITSFQPSAGWHCICPSHSSATASGRSENRACAGVFAVHAAGALGPQLVRELGGMRGCGLQRGKWKGGRCGVSCGVWNGWQV